MISVFVTILNMSLTASIIALAVILVRMILRKVPKVFSYTLWSVVSFRLIFPFSLGSVFRLMPTLTNTGSQDLGMNVSQNLSLQGESLTEIPTNVATYNTFLTNPTGINFSYTFFQIASFIWLVGFIALLLYGITGYVRLKRRVYFATLVRDNIFETDKIKTPFVLGLIRPKIYFPTQVDPLQYDYILKHEQIHIKRRDYLIKPFAYVVLALHWFNPLIWFSYFLMSKDMEMSCDEAVLRDTNEDIRKDYASSLLELSIEKNSLLNPIAFGESNVKERVMNVLNFKKSKKWMMVASIVAVCVFVVGFASNMTTLAVVSELESERMTIDEMTIDGTYSIQEFEELIEGLRNTPTIFQTDETNILIAELEALLAESIRAGRDYVTVNIEDLMNLEGAYSVNIHELGYRLEDVQMIDINDLGHSLEDVQMIDINDLGYSLEDVRMFDSSDLEFDWGMTREEAMIHVRDQLVENGHMTREQTDRLEPLPFN